MCLQWLWVCPAHNCCPIFGCSVKQFKSHIEVSHTVCADFNLAAARQNQVLSRPSVCRPLTWLLIVITQTTSNCPGSRTSLAERSEPCAFLFPQPATWQPGDICKTKKKREKKPRGYKQHPNCTNSSLPQTRAHSGSRAHHKCVCCFSGFTCRNNPPKKRLLLFIYAYKDVSLFSIHFLQQFSCRIFD